MGPVRRGRDTSPVDGGPRSAYNRTGYIRIRWEIGIPETVWVNPVSDCVLLASKSFETTKKTWNCEPGSGDQLSGRL